MRDVSERTTYQSCPLTGSDAKGKRVQRQMNNVIKYAALLQRLATMDTLLQLFAINDSNYVGFIHLSKLLK